MSSSKPSSANDPKFWLAASLVVVSTAGLAASVWPAAHSVAHIQSLRLTQTGQGIGGHEAILDYKLAYWLDRSNTAAALELAKYSLATGQTQLALKQLNGAGESLEALRLRLRTELELNLPSTSQTAQRLLEHAGADDDLILAAAALAAFNQTDLLGSLKSRISSPEALQRINRLEASITATGLELYVLGLPESSQRILATESSSVPRDITLGHLLARKGTSESLSQARELYLSALRLDPSNQEARQGLFTVYTRLGQSVAADEEAALLARLKAGRP